MVQVENEEPLYRTDTGHFGGFFSTGGILRHNLAGATDTTALDTIEQAIEQMRGHVTIKMSGHPPFGAQIILNGHDYVARQAAAAGMAFHKVGNCFTMIADPAGLARIADAWSQHAAVRRLGLPTMDLFRLLVLRAGSR